VPGVPYPFPETDGKAFTGSMFDRDRVAHLGRATGINTQALCHASYFIDREADREDWGEETDAMAAEAERVSELAWHSPTTFIRCLEGLAKRVGAGYRAAWLAERCNFDSEYFESGLFLSDVLGCLAAIRWAQEQGAKRVRFFVA
jgi:hypothetical protein